MNTIFCDNMKKFRQQKELTQEQAAELLGVTAQTISRWECGTTLPDVTLLPELARLYSVTVDDFFRKTSTAYANYAERLAFIFEKTRDPEDFLAAVTEYGKLQKSGTYSSRDRLRLGNVHHLMMCDCMNAALHLYDSVINGGDSDDPDTYKRARSSKANLMQWIGKADDLLAEQTKRTENDPESADEWTYLLTCYRYAGKYDDGCDCFKTAAAKFPSDPHIYKEGGDIFRKLNRFDEAIEYFDKALELSSHPMDTGALFSKASAYESIGDFESAYKIRCQIASYMREMGHDVSASTEEKQAQALLEKMR